jgi:hypothetical protein
MHPSSSFGQQLVDDPRRREAAHGGHGAVYLARGLRIGGSGSGGAVYGLSSFRSAPGSLAKFTAVPSDLPDPIASVLLLLLLFGKQIDYLLSV